MGRGTRKLFTSWTPLSDITMDMGGLIVLAGSHRQHELIDTYGQLDVDRYCENDATTRELIETARAEGLTSLAQSAVRPIGNPPPSALTPTTGGDPPRTGRPLANGRIPHGRPAGLDHEDYVLRLTVYKNVEESINTGLL